MDVISSLRRWLLSGLCGVALLGVGGANRPSASACERPCCVYRWVTIYEGRSVPYTVCVTRYDHCGHAYQVQLTRYRRVEVPVKKLVKVCE